jgi:glycosyltransferase involved in cell wall biosynthesis
MAGCEKRFLEIGKRLSLRGHEVHVFTLQHESSLPREETVEGIKVHRCAYADSYLSPNHFRSLSGVLKYSFATFLRLLGQDFDIYYSNEWPLLHSVLVKPLARPLVQEWCEVWSDPLKVVMLERVLKRLGDYHVAVSEFTKSRLISFLGIESAKISVVPNGVDISKFDGYQNKKMRGRIIYVGRLVPHKHVEMLIDAFNQVKKKITDAELHIVGSGTSMFPLEQKASKIRDCYVHGFLPEDKMLDLLNSAWLFVLPSEREGSGLAVLEAMASGLPFVTVDYSGNAVKELVRYDLGLAVNPSPSFIAAAVLRLLDDESTWKKMSWNAHQFALRYNWDTAADKMENFLGRILQGLS